MTDNSAGDYGTEEVWAIMAPVKGRIRLGMAFGALSGLATLARMICLAMVVLALRERPGAWLWGWMLGALAGTVTGYLARLGDFNQSHYAAFSLERILRCNLAEVPLGCVQTQGAGALTKVITPLATGLAAAAGGLAGRADRAGGVPGYRAAVSLAPPRHRARHAYSGRGASAGQCRCAGIYPGPGGAARRLSQTFRRLEDIQVYGHRKGEKPNIIASRPSWRRGRSW